MTFDFVLKRVFFERGREQEVKKQSKTRSQERRAAEMATDVLIQALLMLLGLYIFFVIDKSPQQILAQLRSKGRASVQAKRHFVQGAQLLSRARTAPNRTTTLALAKSASAEANKALSLDPRDAAAHILKALGHKISALKSLDAALSPAVEALADNERGDALFKRAELQISVNRRGRIDSAVSDLVQAVKLSPENAKAFCLLGSCYEEKEMREEARRAYEAAEKIGPTAWVAAAREGLSRLG